MTARSKRSNRHFSQSRSRIPAVIFIALVALAGTYFILRSFAATPNSLPGDINGDSSVTLNDLSLLLSNFNKPASQASNPNTDVNGDSVINLSDLSILLSNYGRSATTPPTPTPSPTPPSPTPTPPTPAPTGWNPPAVKRDLGFDPACNFSQWDEVLNKEVGTVEIVRSPVAEGPCAAKFSQNGNTTGIWRRVELQNHRPENGAVSGEGGEAWYQFKVYPVSSGSSEYAINQFRTSNVACYTGGTDITTGNQFRFTVRGGAFSGGDDDGCSFPTEKEYTIGTVAMNKWYTLQFHYVWSSGTNGRAEVWLDGAKVVNFVGPTAAKGAGNIMFRTGIYSGPHSGNHSFIVDDVKIFAR